MSIFEEKEEESNAIRIISNKNCLFVVSEGKYYNLSQPQFARMNLSPSVISIDEMIKQGMKIKGLDGEIKLKVEKEWFFGCDASMKMIKSTLGGWIYELKDEKSKIEPKLIWVCSSFESFIKEIPDNLFISIEKGN